MFVAIFSGMRPAAIDNEEVPARVQRDQWVMPCARSVVDPLPRARHEAPQLRRSRRRSSSCDDHHESLRQQRHEQLAAELVAFDHPHLKRQRTRTRAEHGERGLATFPAGIKAREVVKALGETIVDGAMLATGAGLDHIAKRCKCARV